MSKLYVPKQISACYRGLGGRIRSWISYPKKKGPPSKNWDLWRDQSIQDKVFANNSIDITFEQAAIDYISNGRPSNGSYYLTDNYGNYFYLSAKAMLTLLIEGGAPNGKVNDCVFAFKGGDLFVIPKASQAYALAKKET